MSLSLRRALLAGVACAAVAGAAAETGSRPVRAPAVTGVVAATGTVGAIPAQPAAGPGSFADIVDRVEPAVVSVKVKIVDSDQGDDEGAQGLPDVAPGSPFYRFFRRFGLPDEGDSGPRRHSTLAQGSGFFVSRDGYIVTNNHVVDHAKEVTITLANGSTLPARVIGVDKKTDLALLKAQGGGDFAFVTFAAKAPRVGDWVIAVGNPFGLGGTVTAGIVSARGRDIGAGPYDDFLQIDAPVNHGNSGGPTFNAEGEVVGVNTAIFSPSGGSVGIGFAISGDVVRSVIEQLKANGVVTRGWIGVQIQAVSQDIADSLGLKSAGGALISAVEKNSPAEAAGVKSGDVVTAVDGETVADPHDLARRIAATAPKKSVLLALIRNGAPLTREVTLGTMPPEKAAEGAAEPEGQTGDASELARLGLTLRAGRGDGGVVVADVDPDSPAADEGMRAGDVILEVRGRAVTRPSEVADAIASAKNDGKKSVLFRVKSEDGERFLAMPTRAS
ncbi:serine protease Do [Roseiarcus fermentans]|uniref:Probable periplasmic serine endoprotease DegP-like n=1 Tax=Roseiarcus fermentans TaxID=1473586 RepID=A0A366FLU5_9HYPH|nr:Do family serine endopeptidase [Roseiarcus fermentans]RBP15618.1 serine protease Do [Roseiarcus fermentans]